MNQDTIIERLTGLFRDVFDDDALILTPDMTAEDVPGWDSMTHIAIVVETERRFGVKFQTTEIEELHNIGDFAALIDRRGG